MQSRRLEILSAGLMLSFLGLLPFAAAVSQGVSGVLEGRVTDSAGIPVQSVQVAASSTRLVGTRVVQTGANGEFRLLALPAGTYTLQFRLIGYRPTRTDRVEVRLDQTTVLHDITLQLNPVELSEVVVNSERAAMDPYSAAVGSTITAMEFENLPLERNYANIIALLPFASASALGDGPNISGSTGIENAYYVDGLNVTDPYRALGGTTLPYDFVDHVELKAGGYEAEYGRSEGGIVNVVTKSGGNELRGSAFGFFTDNHLTADSRFGLVDLRTGIFRRYDVGLTLGGPIARDRAWFFLAYNPSVERQDLTFPGVGVRLDRKVIHQLAAKLTWRPAAGPTLTTTLVGDPATWDRIGHNSPFVLSAPITVANPDPLLGHWKDGGVHGAVRADWPVSQRFLIEAEAARSDVRLVAEAATERGRTDPLFMDLTTGVWSGGYGNAFDHHTTRTAAAAASTVFIGSHLVKAGFQYENNFLDEDWRWLSDGPDSAGFIVRYAASGPGSVITFPLDFRTRVRSRVLSLFVQGSLLVLPGLRLNPGVRWQGEYHKGVNSGMRVAITDEWQPRIGATYVFGRRGRHKFTASYGRFYEQLPLLPVAFFVGPLFQDFILYDHDPRSDPAGGTRLSFTQVAVPDLSGEHFDEFTLGYEHQLSGGLKLEIHGIHREQREVVQDALDPATPTIEPFGNPGRGRLAFLPRPIRQYTAGTITVQRFGARFGFFGSYTISRTYGNYEGLYSSSGLGLGLAIPNTGLAYDDSAQLVNATGLLPNDRTHVLKWYGSYRLASGLAIGTTILVQSGTPLSELGGNPINPISYTFLDHRGTAGRTPATWDWNLRLSYDVRRAQGTRFTARTMLDLFHILSLRRPIWLDEQHFFAADASGQYGENANYLRPLLYQPPMSARVGVIVDF
jgi:carboxypeptidase family protein